MRSITFSYSQAQVTMRLNQTNIFHFGSLLNAFCSGCDLFVTGATFNLFTDNIACYPYKTNSTPKRAFATHANRFCWESTGENYSPHHTNITGEGNDLLDNALAVKALYKIVPYLFITEVRNRIISRGLYTGYFDIFDHGRPQPICKILPNRRCC